MFTIIAKITSECNHRCVYCYGSDYPEMERMDIQTLENLMLKGVELNSNGITSIIWHGGEPLLVGIDFFRKIIDIQKNIPDHTFKNSIQSNGSLLTNELVDFFEKNNFSIGISLDGIKKTHDTNRPQKNGRSSFEKVLSWILELKKRGIGGDALCVLNKNTAPYISEIYSFAKSYGINFKFVPQFQAGRALKNPDLALSPKELTDTFIKLFDIWFYDNSGIVLSLEPFESLVLCMGLSKNIPKADLPLTCSFRNACAYSFLSVTPSGDIYPCGRFVGVSDYLYGNINKINIHDLLKSPIRDLFLLRHKGLTECEDCIYKDICNSGCPYFSFLAYGNIKHKDPLCETYKTLFKHIEKALVIELDNYTLAQNNCK